MDNKLSTENKQALFGLLLFKANGFYSKHFASQEIRKEMWNNDRNKSSISEEDSPK